MSGYVSRDNATPLVGGRHNLVGGRHNLVGGRHNLVGGRHKRRRSKTHKKSHGESSHAKKAVGSRAEVWHGNAKHTSGGLKKKDLMMKHGHIVSKKASQTAKKNFSKNLPKSVRAPLFKKGHRGRSKTRRHSRK